MDTVRVFCAGKINLSLNILSRGEKLHYLDSVMAATGVGDIVTAARRSDGALNIVFEGENFVKDSIGQNNSVTKAAQLFFARYEYFGADIVIQKNIPVGGGLGGSSADAAGALLALSTLCCDKKIDSSGLFELAAEAGSDVPFSLLNAGIIPLDSQISRPWAGGSKPSTSSPQPQRAARVTGTGEIIRPIKNNLILYAVIAIEKNASVNSGDAYRVFDEIYPGFVCAPSDNDALEKALGAGSADAFAFMGNALTAASERLNPGIKKTRAALLYTGAFYTLMTGSGAAVVGFFKDFMQAQTAAEELKKNGFWAVAAM